MYESGNFSDFIKLTNYKIKSINDKRILKLNIEKLSQCKAKNIELVIKEADEFGVCKIDDKLINFIQKNEYLYNRVKEIAFSEFQNLYRYLEGFTPFSTQHKTKGSEYNNVLIILDNGGWNKYNFKKLFENSAKDTVKERTEKILYVCCTRAKENLVIFFYEPSIKIIDKAKYYFGESNVINMDL